MLLPDVKRVLVKNLHVLKTQSILKNANHNFEEYWELFINHLRIDPVTRNSWYLL